MVSTVTMLSMVGADFTLITFMVRVEAGDGLMKPFLSDTLSVKVYVPVDVRFNRSIDAFTCPKNINITLKFSLQITVIYQCLSSFKTGTYP